MDEALRAHSFLDELHTLFDRATTCSGGTVQKFEIGGDVIELRIAGDELLGRLTPAFAHLRVSDDVPARLRVCLWDSQTSGVPPPRPPWTWGEADGFSRGEVRFATGSPYRFAYNTDSELLQAADLGAGRACVWMRSAAALPGWEIAAPLRSLLNWWMRSRSANLVHGAAIAPPGDTTESPFVLLTARGGSGKSTLAAAALQAGWNFMGDDYVALLPGADGRTQVASLYATFKLNKAYQAASLPTLETLRMEGVDACDNGRKSVFSAWPAHASQIRRRAPLAAIIVPRVAAEDASRGGERISPASALAALAPTSLFQLPGAGAESLGNIADLIKAAPAYRLALGPSHAANLEAVAAVLDEVATTRPKFAP